MQECEQYSQMRRLEPIKSRFDRDMNLPLEVSDTIIGWQLEPMSQNVNATIWDALKARTEYILFNAQIGVQMHVNKVKGIADVISTKMQQRADQVEYASRHNPNIPPSVWGPNIGDVRQRSKPF